MQKKGCVKIRDLIDIETLRLYTYDKLKEKYNCTLNFMDYASLMNCLPKEWKTLLLEVNVGDMEDNHRSHVCKLLEAKKTCNMVYWKLLQKDAYKPICIEKWTMELNEIYDESKWSSIFELPFKVCRDTKLRSFQWKIVNRSLITNKQLHRFGFRSNCLCSFCGKE